MGIGKRRFVLGVLFFLPPYEEVVRDGVPRVVYADEEQKRRRGAHEEQRRPRVGVSDAR